MRRFSGTDAAMLTADRPNSPNHVAPLSFYNPATAPGGRVGYDDVLAYLGARLHTAVSFRQKMRTVPLGLDRPYWVDDPDFDLEFHVRHIALPRPGTWQQLCRQVERIGARGIDLSRPPWELWLIDGLDDIDGMPPGTFATLFKVHHAAVDGVAGVEMFSAVHELEAALSAPPEPPPTWEPEAAPSSVQLLRGAGVHAIGRPVAFGRLTGKVLRSSLPHVPTQLIDTLRREPGRPGPVIGATRFNGVVSPHRAFDARRFPMAEIRAVRAAVPKATVNDVAMAMVGGALRYYLLDKGEQSSSSVVAMMPVSVRSDDPAKAGNQFTYLPVSLGTNLEDPRERLGLIQRASAELKESDRAVGARAMMQLSEALPGALVGFASRNLIRAVNRAGLAPGMHTVVTNVPGPRVPLYFAGAELQATFGMAPVVDGMGLIHAVSSYLDQFMISVAACREMMPDPEFYMTCIERSYTELTELWPA